MKLPGSVSLQFTTATTVAKRTGAAASTIMIEAVCAPRRSTALFAGCLEAEALLMLGISKVYS